MRALKVVIENGELGLSRRGGPVDQLAKRPLVHAACPTEQLVPSTSLPSKSSDVDDFDSIAALIKEEHQDNTPAYILVKLDGSSDDQAERQWCLCTYVPDNGNVRSKMLYSSTKATLSRQLGEAKFRYTLHASTPVS